MDMKHKDVNPACENIQGHLEKNVAANRMLKGKNIVKYVLMIVVVLSILTIATLAAASML